MSLGSLYNDTGRFDQALMELESANRGLRVSFSEDHIYIAKTEMLIGEALIGLDRFDEAEAYCQRSWAIIDASRNEDDPLRQQALGIMIKLYESWEKPERAREYRVHSSD